jgi:hypothetical protein
MLSALRPIRANFVGNEPLDYEDLLILLVSAFYCSPEQYVFYKSHVE